TSMIVSYSVFLLATTTAIAYLIGHYLAVRKIKSSQKVAVQVEKAEVEELSLATSAAAKGDLAIGHSIAQEYEQAERADSLEADTRNNVRPGKKTLEQQFPHLALFDELTYRLILLGFPILAFGIITGAMWA